MKRKLLLISMIFVMVLSLTDCASWDRLMTDIKSEVGDGLQRTVTVYTANGDVIATYEGKTCDAFINVLKKYGGAYGIWYFWKCYYW